MPTLQVKRHENLKEQVYRKVKSLLTSGQLEPDVFYSANQFAERLGVSRTPAREALLQLEVEGFLVAQDNRGFKIKEFTPKEARDFFEMRRLVESYAVGKLCDDIKADDLHSLESCIVRMRSAAKENDTASFIASDEDFHLTMVSHCDNLFLKSLVMNIRDFITIFGRRIMGRESSMKDVIEEHAHIVEALKARQKDRAISAMSRHLEETEKRLMLS
jgi:DNA-binding GntR family transcriptional regulator